MPPINCTSKCRMFRTRRPASRTTAKGFDQNLVQHFLQRVVFLFFEALGAVKIVFLFRRNRAESAGVRYSLPVGTG